MSNKKPVLALAAILAWVMCIGFVPDSARGADAQDAVAAVDSALVTVLAGTTMQAKLFENANSSFNSLGETVLLIVTEDVSVNGRVVIAKGAQIKAQVNNLAQRGMMGKGGDLTFSPVSVQAVDGQWLQLDKDQMGAAGAGAHGGMIFAVGLFAKGRAAFVQRGTTYEVSVRRDTPVDTSKSVPLPALRAADAQATASVGELPRINFSTGKAGDDIVFRIQFPPELSALAGSAADSVRIVRMHDVLPEPVKSIQVNRDTKDKNVLHATFAWWGVIKYAEPGATPVVLQCQLSDGRVAQADLVMTTEWKLK